MSFNISAQEEKKEYAEAFKLIEVWLEAQKDFDDLPSLTAIVVDDQDVLWSAGFGWANIDKKVKSEASTLYGICSISKLFTSVAIMKLYDDGKLRLDDLVSDLLPAYDLKQDYPESGPITVRSLMTHSSGLPRESAHSYWTGPDFPFPSKEELNEKLSTQKTLYPASIYFQYSNLALSLLGEIVEEVSGVSYDEYVTQNILQPLALSNTRTVLPEQMHGTELAIGYSATPRNDERAEVNLYDAKGITPAAGFSSNVLDLGKFASWQFRLRDTTIEEILKPSTIKYMHNVHWTDPNWKTTWGLGFSVYKGDNGSTWVAHGGSCPGYQSTLQMDLKNERAYSVMINANGTGPGKYVAGIKQILGKVKAHEISKDSTNQAEHKDLQEYVGYYDPMPWWSEEYICTWGDMLVTLALPSRQPGEAMTFYKHVEGDTFRRIRDDDELGEAIVFERDQFGTITRYIINGNFVNKIDK